MERKLASIRKVREIKQIEGADAIELAIVDGWQCVAKKGEFKVNDLCVYFEIDSFLPIKDEFEFLRKSSYKKMGEAEGFRLKTIKLRGELSQGLIIPISNFNEDIQKMEEGTDLTDTLEVQKYEPPIPAQLAGQVKGSFPSYIRKTDQERIQNLFYKINEKYKDVDFEVTLKLDGTSCTYYVVNPLIHNTKLEEPADFYFGHCSRNLDTKEGDSTPWIIARDNKIRDNMIEFFKNTGRSIAIQGELMGPSIQGNREKLTAPKFFLYDIWDIDNQRYLTKDERKEIVEFIGVDMVPVINTNLKVLNEFKDINDVLKFAEVPSINHPIGEGLVFKSNTLVNGDTLSFKAISNKFLLKSEN